MNVSLPGLIKEKKLLAYFDELTGEKQLDKSIIKLVIPAVDLTSDRILRSTNIDEAGDRKGLYWV